MFGLIPYLFIFLLGVWNLRYNTKDTNKLFYFILFVFSAIRYDVGYDYMSYYEMIKSLDEFRLSRIEIFEKILIQFSHETFIQLFYIVNSFITIYFTKWALEKKSVDMSISTLTFLCFPLMFTHSFSIIRFWSAIAILFYASLYLESKKIIKFIILLIIAFCFHKSSLIALLFIPLYYINIPLIVNILILITSFFGGEFILSEILSGIFSDAFFGDQVMRYVTKSAGDGLNKIPFLYLLIDVYLLFRSQELRKHNKDIYRWVSIYNVGVSLLFLLSFEITLAGRLCRPFLIYLLLLMPFIVEYKTMFKKFKNVKLNKQIFGIFCFVVFVYLLSIYNDELGKSQYLPYQIFLFH